MSLHDQAVLAFMAQFGLDPGTIKWTGKWESFHGPGQSGGKKSASYRAFADDPVNVQFRDFKTGLDEHWWAKNGKPDDFDPEKWAETQRQRGAKREEEWAKAAEKAQARFDAAGPATPKHPYLVKKGITDVTGIRQEGTVLLIPMKSFALGAPVVSLQEIRADGTKRFMKGCKAAGTRTTIGSGDYEGTLYITEGWATGHSIHQVTGHPVVVAFSSNNLACIAKEMRERRPQAEVIIAADNDRWSSTPKGMNPGVIAAREAAHLTNALVAIPDFQDLTGNPTDFNDLLVREGEDAVRQWIDPAVAHHAATMEGVDAEPPPPPTSEEPIPEEGTDTEATVWTDDAPFRCLGYNRGAYYYLPKESGQIVHLTPNQHDRKTLLQVAHLSWWEETFPAKGKEKTDWTLGADALLRASHKAGVFSHDKVRGRGCWPEEDEEGNVGVVLHLGDRLLPPGGKKYVEPDRYKCPEGRFYERLSRLAGPSKKHVMTLEETQEILRLFQDLLWHDDASGLLAAGWTVLAPLGGVLPWRPHIWLTGGTGSGKTTVQRDLIVPLTGGMRYYYEGGSTEAGIRQEIRSDSLPVIYDEAEKTDIRSEKRIQSVIGLARGASSTAAEAKTAKGTPSGTVLAFQIRSMFCLASVGGALKTEADKTRISQLQMKSKANLEEGEKLAHWRRYEPRLKKVKVELGRELVARTLGWLRDGRITKTLEVFREAASDVLADPRFGDQYGTLYGGAWTLMADEPPDKLEARELVGGDDLSRYVEDQSPEGERVLDLILQQRERIEGEGGAKTVAVGRLVHAVATGSGLRGGITLEDADHALKELGLRVDPLDGGGLMIANNSEWVRHVLRDTQYALSFRTALRTIPGCDNNENRPVRFHANFIQKVTRVPLDKLTLLARLTIDDLDVHGTP